MPAAIGPSLQGEESSYALVHETPIASGRLSDVWLACDEASGCQVAIKSFHSEVREESLRSYLRELEMVSALDHANILPVLDRGQSESGAFLVLPYMEGGNLRRMLDGRSFCPMPDLLPLLRQVAAGVDHAHSVGVIHGDIKPENILLGGSPRVARLADFGVARHFVVEDTVATWGGITRPPAGSSAYLSPEQLLKNEQSPRSDLYSLALVAYELLTGRLPFDLKAPLFIQLKARVEGDLVPARVANAQLGEAAASALMRALAVDASRRPQSAAALVRSLEQAPKRWDVFIAHAGADLEPARRLYDLLDGKLTVFLDQARLRLGDSWDTELARAQRDSLLTVVLVSQRSDAAYYEREEIAAAIRMARADPAAHRVVPVYLDADSARQPPYGLSIRHGVQLKSDSDYEALAAQLVRLAADLRDLS